MKVKDLLTDKSKWTKLALYRDEKGSQCFGYQAKQCCLLGAVFLCYEPGETRIKVLEKIHDAIGVDVHVGQWNDGHSFEDVRALVEELDI